MPYDEKLLFAGELYDYKNDPLETNNVYNSETYAKVKVQLTEIFKDYVAIQNDELKYTGANPNKIEGTAPVSTPKSVKASTATLITIGESLNQNWKLIKRKGAVADIAIKDKQLVCDVTKLGERPWDLQVTYKQPLQLMAGNTLTIKMMYQGPEMKMNFGPVNDVRIGRKIPACAKAKMITIDVAVTESGAYDCKLSFVTTGKHIISNIETTVQ